MRLKLGSALLGVALAPVLALAGDVSTDYDHAYDFDKIKTFTAKIGTGWGNPLGEKRVLDEINHVKKLAKVTDKMFKNSPPGSAKK